LKGLWSTKEGVGETSGQTAGSYFEKSVLSKEARSFKAGPAEETSFSSFGAGILNYPQFHRAQSPA
jgi:hypothetical protein